MTKWLQSRIFWGFLLILAGLAFLLQNLNVFEFGGLFWGVIFIIGGIFFLSIYVSNRANWWSLIPGFVLLGISVIIILSSLAPNFVGAWGGSIVLGSIGVAFAGVYLTDRNNWWAVIPGGVMVTLAFVAGLGEIVSGLEVGGIFFLGLGLTFALVALAPSPQGEMRWAWIPAGVLLIMGVLFTAAAGEIIQFILPVVLILVGLYLVYRAFIRR
jgi:hypothetical protein